MIRAARSALAARAGRAFDLPTLGRTLAVCAPTIALYGATGDVRWLLASIATVSIAIAVERVGIAPLGALAQGTAIVAGFLSLSCALSAWPAFVAGCATLAAAAVALSRCGARLRSLGNFVFIPSLYLTCEAAAAHHSATRLVPYLGAAMLPAIALSGVQAWRNAPAAHRLHALARWRGARELGRPAASSDAAQAIVAVALAVAAAALLVEWRHIDNGQWAIWSAASVVTGDAATARVKLRDRGLGALAGVPLGLAAGHALPHGALVYTLATLASVLTLVAFRHYATGFGARCACIACASWVAQQSTAIAAERVVNVLAGGLIGIACVLATHWFATRPLTRRHNARANRRA
ncbi:FUSC family protein [Burkholderia pseudomallei]|uniref:FUSC family protein n=1 Tax=Burkholderia pseudomallei TaxID=28450 RepID=UPI00051546AA|nr:FUSC family protein [Burkholderia pseudomallei]AIS89963.1 fusaric acid resistance -like family protein [Burkholderia pseudomallei NAU35A-3]KGS48665.1 fusaric acid resistance -like family protein [Burkholderia pseudomallei MSHR5613]KGV21769.1 fusaric acid resistance -like family protein [Burkholderia pseudomallei MSHR4300]KGV79238.1 fusaric acid resistance -like family protein [Burkholderia pseudomallei MSHR4375]KGX41574.1 fusaric acid resistance -like family protein [Burkholderia pseudomall